MSHTHERPDRGSTTSTPRWVKVLGIIALIVVLLFVILLIVGGGNHGPGRHSLTGDGLVGEPVTIVVTDTGQAIQNSTVGDASMRQRAADPGGIKHRDLMVQ